MSEGHKIWRTLLQVEEPWSVLDYRLDNGRRRHDITIGMDAPRSWFGFGRKPAVQPVVHSWRHLNVGDVEIHVHVAAPHGADLSRVPWAGESGQPFTRALSQQIFVMLREGCSPQTICTYLRLPVADLWRFRHAMDTGQWAAPEVPAAKVEAAAAPVADSGIPDANDPVWRGLLDGSRQIDIRVLSLKLMLTRLRAQMDVIKDEEVRQLKIEEFRRFFAKNKQLLAYELNQMRGAQ